MSFTLPELPYAHDALEPYVDKATMEIHHGKHHAAYVTNLNKSLETTEWKSRSLEEILANVSKLPIAVRNNGGGHWNHSAFWNWMKPKVAGTSPTGKLGDAIKKDFGSFDSSRNNSLMRPLPALVPAGLGSFTKTANWWLLLLPIRTIR